MSRYIFTALIAASLLLSGVSSSKAQDKGHSHEHKEMKKDEVKLGPLQKFDCGSPCNFAVTSHDESELVSVAKAHVKTHHNMDATDKDLKKYIVNVEEKASSKEEKVTPPKK